MSEPLAEIYRDYIACLNRQDWDDLGLYVHEEAIPASVRLYAERATVRPPGQRQTGPVRRECFL